MTLLERGCLVGFALFLEEKTDSFFLRLGRSNAGIACNDLQHYQSIKKANQQLMTPGHWPDKTSASAGLAFFVHEGLSPGWPSMVDPAKISGNTAHKI
jgi:hypothetical protein